MGHNKVQLRIVCYRLNLFDVSIPVWIVPGDQACKNTQGGGPPIDMGYIVRAKKYSALLVA